MIRLYHYPQTTADRVRWMLGELSVPYEAVLVDLMAGEHKKPDYLKINPNGLVPALADGETVIFESAAILLHLADKFGPPRLAPSPGSPERAAYYQWIVFTATMIDPPAFQVLLHTALLPPDRRNPAVLAESGRKFEDAARVVEDRLAGEEFLVGRSFSAADVMMASALLRGRSLLEARPTLRAYVDRLTSRPAAPFGKGP
jgi:glutathione S-transferase